MKIKRKLLLILVLGLVLPGLVACSKEASGTSDTRLVLAQISDVTSLDPHGANDEVSYNLVCQIFSTLVRYTEDRELVGDLAESWEEVDPRTWHFKIRPGVKFHNGEDLTLEDIKFSLERALEKPIVAHILEDIKEVNIIGDSTIEIRTYEPSAPLMANLASPTASILHEETVRSLGEEVDQKPNGTGPFKLLSWKPGEKIVLEKFEGYYGEPAAIDQAEYRVISESNSQLMALETGEIDIAYGIEPINIDIVKEKEDLDYIKEDSFTVHYLGFNTQKPPFDNPKLRQAIAYAIDMDEVLEVVLDNTVRPADCLLNDNVIGSGGEYSNYPYNKEKARELLKEAGFEDGLDMKLMISDSNIREKISELVQAQLREVGVNLEVEMSEWGAFLERVGGGLHDAYLLAATVSTGDGDDPFTLLLHSNQLGDGGNRAFYVNPRVDRLIEEGRKELDPARRIEIYQEIQTIVNKELPIYPMYYNNQACGINKRVKNFRLNPAGYHFLEKVELE